MSLIELPVYHMRNITQLLDECVALAPGEAKWFKLWEGDAPDVEVEMKGVMDRMPKEPGWMLSAQTRSGCDIWEPLQAFMVRFGVPFSLVISRAPDDDQTPLEALEIYSNRWCHVEVYW